MALAGVSYTTGREGNDEYNETLNGVQTSNALDHNIDVQSVDYDELRQALMRAGQILGWRKK